MPTPGSHKYDQEKSRTRSWLESQGVHDDEAESEARRRTRDEGALSPAAVTDRARGPLGESGSADGDPGDVIDLRSPSFSDHTMIPVRHAAADGNSNISPPLEWSAVPDGTAELAVVCEDLDAPDGHAVHWLLTGIDPGIRSIDEGSPPAGTTVWPNVAEHRAYDGPLPPVGDEPHRYAFRLYALDDVLDIDSDAPTEAVREELDERRTATGTLIGLFAR